MQTISWVRSQQNFSVKVYLVSILSFVGCIISMSTVQISSVMKKQLQTMSYVPIKLHGQRNLNFVKFPHITKWHSFNFCSSYLKL